MLYYFCCLEDGYRRRAFSYGLMDQLSRILIDVFNSPLLISIVMQHRKHL